MAARFSRSPGKNGFALQAVLPLLFVLIWGVEQRRDNPVTLGANTPFHVDWVWNRTFWLCVIVVERVGVWGYLAFSSPSAPSPALPLWCVIMAVTLILMFPDGDPRSNGRVINKKRPWIKHGAKCSIVSAPFRVARGMKAVHFHKCPHKREYDLVSSEFIKSKTAVTRGASIA